MSPAKEAAAQKTGAVHRATAKTDRAGMLTAAGYAGVAAVAAGALIKRHAIHTPKRKTCLKNP